MKFKEGDRVAIRRDSCFYGISLNNPENLRGTIKSNIYSHTLGIFVEWDNDTKNFYAEEDLRKSYI